MATRYTQTYLVQSDDGYVDHTAGDIGTADHTLSLLLYWNFWDSNGFCDWFALFGPVNIPNGSTIVRAELLFSLYYVSNGWVSSEIRISDRQSIYSAYSDYTNQVGTNEAKDFTLDQVSQTQIVQLDITDVVQEKVNQEDWVAGNNMLFYTGNTDGETVDSGADIDSYEYNPVMTLTIVYEPPVVPSLQSILGGSRIEGFKYEWLTLENGIYIHNGYLDNYVKDANIKIDFTRDIIGTINLEMKNYDSINFLSDLIRPHYYTIYEGTTYTFPLGTYMLSSPKKRSDGNFITRYVQGYDLLKALEDDKTTTSTYYAAGTDVYDTITTLLDGVGNWVRYSIEPSTETLVEDMSYELGRSKLFIINSLLNTINYYPLWANGEGVFCSIPWADYNNIAWEFEDNSYSLYEPGITQDIDYSEMYNRVVVIARQLTEDTAPLYKVWTFEDESMDAHPLSYTSLGRYITKIFDSEAVSQTYVDLRARREILKMLEVEETLEYNHAYITSRLTDGLPFQGDCFKFKNDKLDVNAETYKIETHEWYLKVGEPVKSTIRRITSSYD